MARELPHVELSEKGRRELQQVLKQGTGGNASLRAAVILLSEEGLSAEAIGRILGVTARTVRACRRRWRLQGSRGLSDVPRSGRPTVADARYVRVLMRTVRADPRGLGYAFSRWTAPRLATYLLERTGIELSDDSVAELLRTHGYVWKKSKLTTSNLADEGEKKTCREEAKIPAKGGVSGWV